MFPQRMLVLFWKSGIDMNADVNSTELICANLRRPALLEQSAEETEALTGGKARDETLSKMVNRA